MGNKGDKRKKGPSDLCKVAEFLKVVSEESRLKILCLLKKEELCVCQIWKELELSQNLTSHHLKILKDSGLVSQRKEGLKVFYSLRRSKLDECLGLLNKSLNYNL